MLNLKQTLNSIILKNVEWMGIRKVKTNEAFLMVREQKFDLSAIEESEGIYIEVLANGMFGYACTSDLSLPSLRLTAEKAYNSAINASKYKVFNFSEKERPKAIGEYCTPRISGVKNVINSENIDLLMDMSKILHSDKRVISTNLSLTGYEILTEYASTNGSHFFQDIMIYYPYIEAVGQFDKIVQERSTGRDLALQGGLEDYSKQNLLTKSENIVKELGELLEADLCPEMKTTLVLKPSMMTLQIHESIGHALELDRILGDERNYAGWSHVKLDDFGKLKYGNDLLNICFDPTVPKEIASLNFDHNGLSAQKEYLIQNGLLKRAIGGAESQVRCSLPGVACSRASNWNRAPIDRMGNINMDVGDTSFDDMIKNIEHGIILDGNNSWSIDDYRRKFQFGAEYAHLIENGKITKVLRNANYRGETVPFWHNLIAVGDKNTVNIAGTMNCGKGEPNQIMFVGHASPVCAFKDIEVFGGTK